MYNLSFFDIVGGFLAFILFSYITIRILSLAYFKSRSDVLQKDIVKIINALKGKENG